MTEVYIAYALFDELRSRRDSFPAAQSRTITGVAGSLITVNTPINGDYSYGVMELTNDDSAAYGLSGIIESINSNQITLDRPFIGARKPAVGDTVQVHGGPLAQSAIYYGVAPSLAPDRQAGKNFFITVEPRQGDRAWDTAFGRGLKGRDGLKDVYGYRLIVETPWGEEGTDVEAIHNYIELPICANQVLYYAFRVRIQEAQNLWIGGSASWAYETWERPGLDGDEVFQAAVIEIDVQSR